MRGGYYRSRCASKLLVSFQFVRNRHPVISRSPHTDTINASILSAKLFGWDSYMVLARRGERLSVFWIGNIRSRRCIGQATSGKDGLRGQGATQYVNVNMDRADLGGQRERSAKNVGGRRGSVEHLRSSRLWHNRVYWNRETNRTNKPKYQAK
jgi:hypothetical protein